MPNLITDYAHDHYPPSLADEVMGAFDLFNDFNLIGYTDDFTNLLMQQSYMDPADVSDAYMALVLNKQHYIIKQHLIDVVPGISIIHANKIMRGLWLLNDIEDTSSVLHILESFDEPKEMLVNILSFLIDVDDATLYSIIEDVSPDSVAAIKERMYTTQHSTIKLKQLSNEVRLVRFGQWVGHDNYLSKQLMASEVPIGLSIEQYTPLVVDVLHNKTIAEIALNVYSLLMITDRSDESPIIQYQDCSGSLFSDLSTITGVGTEIRKIEQQFNVYMQENP